MQRKGIATMSATVLFTRHPGNYTEMIENSETDCTLVTDEGLLQNELKKQKPQILLIESDEVSSSLLSSDDWKEKSPFTPSAIVYAEKEVLKKLLYENPVLREAGSSYEIPQEWNRKLDKALMEFHFSPSLRGYHYLKQAFYYELQNTRQISAVKKDIYEAVSNCYCTSIYSVERGITFSIRKAYQKDPQKFQEIFSVQHKAPSNMQFLKTFLIYLQQSGLF